MLGGADMNKQGYLNVLKQYNSFTRMDLFETMNKYDGEISLSSFKVKLQELLKQREIVRVGRNMYCVPSENTYLYDYCYSEYAKAVVALIQEQHPYLEFTVFEIVQLNEFVNHQLAHNIIFVSVEGDLGDFVFDTLKEKYPGKVLLNPTTEIFHQYWYDEMIVIQRLITETPRNKDTAWAARIEKILVDLMADPLLLNTLSLAELPGIYEDVFQKYVIDESCLFRYAKRRGVEKKILNLIRNKTAIILKTRR